MLDSAVKVNKQYYPHTLLEECKYEIKRTPMEKLINDDLDLSSSDESDHEPDNEPDYESDSEFDNDESQNSDNDSGNKSSDSFANKCQN